jgi:hypothetical protein
MSMVRWIVKRRARTEEDELEEAIHHHDIKFAAAVKKRKRLRTFGASSYDAYDSENGDERHINNKCTYNWGTKAANNKRKRPEATVGKRIAPQVPIDDYPLLAVLQYPHVSGFCFVCCYHN